MLNPCLFCGGEAKYFEERIFIMNNAFLMGVKCEQCGGAYMAADKNLCPNDVYKAWNNRIPEVTVKATHWIPLPPMPKEGRK